MIQEKRIEIDGVEFFIGKFPATVGREIISQYPTTAAPVIGNYARNEEISFKVLSHAQIEKDGARITLSDRTFIDKYILASEKLEAWEIQIRLEKEVISYNLSNFQKELASNFFKGLTQKIDSKVIETLTKSLGQLFQKDLQPYKI